MSRLIFYFTCVVILCSIVFLAGIYSGRQENIFYRVLIKIKNDVELVFSESTNIVGTEPTHWTVNKKYEGKGVTRQLSLDHSDELVFMQGFFDNKLGLRLIQRDGAVVSSWSVSFNELSKYITHLRNTPETDWNVGFHGAVLLPDGSVVFNISYIGFFKFDKCGSLLWSIDEPTHHSVSLNDDGSFWVSSADNVYTQEDTDFDLYEPPYVSDTLIQVSPEGKIIKKISLLNLFIKENEVGLLTLASDMAGRKMPTNRPDFKKEIFHLNDVEELSNKIAHAFPSFEAGDLLVSLRNRNLVLVVDPSKQIIKWWHIGPWVRQHDPDWGADGMITLFDNGRDDTGVGNILGGSKIVAIDPVTRNTYIKYGGNESEFFYTEIRGKHHIFNDGRILILEADAGRLFEIDIDRKIRWEYLNHYNDKKNTRLTDASVYPIDYFENDWKCLNN